MAVVSTRREHVHENVADCDVSFESRVSFVDDGGGSLGSG